MSELKLDPLTNDIALEQGVVVLTTGSEASAQRIRSRLLTVRGEWFLDTNFGLDYHGVIWVKGLPAAVVDAHIQREILRGADKGSRITSYVRNFDSATRHLSVSAQVESPDGVTITVSI